MGEAKEKERQVQAAVEQYKKSGSPPTVTLTLMQGVVLTTFNREVATLGQDAQFLEQIGQKEAASALLSAAEHLGKFQARYLADAQRSIILPKPSDIAAIQP